MDSNQQGVNYQDFTDSSCTFAKATSNFFDYSRKNYRIGPFSILDLLGTIIIAIIVAYIFQFSYIKTIIVFLVVGEIIHLALPSVTTPVKTFLTDLF